MRYLGRFPSEGQVKKAILPLIHEESGLELQFDRVEAYLLDLLNGTEFMPSSYENLLMSFRKLDPKGKGILKVEQFKFLIKDSE